MQYQNALAQANANFNSNDGTAAAVELNGGDVDGDTVAGAITAQSDQFLQYASSNAGIYDWLDLLRNANTDGADTRTDLSSSNAYWTSTVQDDTASRARAIGAAQARWPATWATRK